MFYPAIPDGKTWSELGEHGEHGEHENMEMMENINHSIFSSKHSFVSQMTRNTLLYGIYGDG